ncbi:ankyrin repeat domain-containing protein [Acidovorax sp. 1608163]|uniref:ankyrin repeat domain-containing protein n=1 Tax=Acidovorax sp. 1608163 TaxID=2478662 RepID=UPI000EF73927|nr:ankyrin repeat domain-containing protein [Acidovorax sp. 1608163]AYM98113.1 ankyrin repeat domain-containing protein [Acidovorax sp. 1608163]
MPLSFVARLLALLSLGLVSQAAVALDCGEALLGDYALQENGVAVLRVEQTQHRLYTRQKDADGQWSASFFESAVVRPDDVRKVMGAADGVVPLCGIRLPGGVLFKLPVGHAYAVSSATEKSTVPRKALSGYLYYEASGFAVSAADLFPVARAGASPALPVAPAAAGLQVPATAMCPGQRLPDMQQAAFDALPEAQRQWFARLDGPGQARFVCGQYLHDVIGRYIASNRPSAAPKEVTLREASLLLQAGQVPRNAQGKASWATVSQSLLVGHLGTGRDTIPWQKEVFALFVNDLLPHIDPAPDNERDLYDQVALIKEVALMPPEFGMVALKSLNRQGTLQRTLGGSSERIALQVLRFNTWRLPGPTLDYLLAEAGPDAANDGDVMTGLIDRNGIEGVQRVLNAGANPAQQGWLARARMDPAAASGVYPLLLNAAFAAAQGDAVRSRLLGDQLTLVLGKLLAQCPSEPDRWKEIDFLVDRGARVRGVFDNGAFATTNLGVFALKCPQGFTALLDRGLPLDALYPYPSYAGERQDTPLLMYLTAAMEDFPPQAPVLVQMLSRHNNANVRPGCAGCSPYNPLEMAIISGNTDLVQVLLDFGADPNDPNKDGRPPAIRAVVQNRVDMLEMMHARRKLDVNRLDRPQISLLAWAACAGAQEAMAWLVREGAVNTGQERCQKKG